MPVELRNHRNNDLVWVVFQSRIAVLSRYQRWYCAAPFSHCWCYWPTYYPEPGLLSAKYTTKLEFTSYGLVVESVYDRPENLTQKVIETDFVTDVVVFRPKKKPAKQMISLLDCVGVIKSRLGVRAWWVWTPQQLHRYLINNHGQSLKLIRGS